YARLLSRDYVSVDLPSFPSIATDLTDIYTLSLHDALPILFQLRYDYIIKLWGDLMFKGMYNNVNFYQKALDGTWERHKAISHNIDRKSTRLNSSHVKISYAVFCLKKKITTVNTSPSARTRP